MNYSQPCSSSNIGLALVFVDADIGVFNDKLS